MGLALALDEPRYIKGLDSVAMDSKPTLGQRLIEAVIPSRFKDAGIRTTNQYLASDIAIALDGPERNRYTWSRPDGTHAAEQETSDVPPHPRSRPRRIRVDHPAL